MKLAGREHQKVPVCCSTSLPDAKNANKYVPYSVSAVRWHWPRRRLWLTFHFSFHTKAKCPVPQWPQRTINHITWESSLVSTRTLLSYYYFFFVYIMHFVNSESRLLVTIITNHYESSLLVQVSTNRIRYRTCGSENATWHLDTRHTHAHTHTCIHVTYTCCGVRSITIITSAIHLLQLQHVRTPGIVQPVCAGFS